MKPKAYTLLLVLAVLFSLFHVADDGLGTSIDRLGFYWSAAFVLLVGLGCTAFMRYKHAREENRRRSLKGTVYALLLLLLVLFSLFHVADDGLGTSIDRFGFYWSAAFVLLVGLGCTAFMH